MKNYVQRYLWFIIGVIINSFGIALITKAQLGTSPISSVAYVFSLEFPLTLGQFSFIMNMFFIFGQFILLRKDFQMIQFLQIAVNVIFSCFIDISMNLLSALPVDTIPAKLVVLLLGCTVLALGISIEIAPDVLVVPGEGMVRAIAKVSKKRFGSVKVMFDVSLVIIALIFSFLFFGRLNGLGAGTIVSAVLVGRIVNMINKNVPFISYVQKLA